MMKRTCHFMTFQPVKKVKITGLIEAIKLEGQKTVTENWYTTNCLSEILQEVNVCGLMPYHESASSHTPGSTAKFLKVSDDVRNRAVVPTRRHNKSHSSCHNGFIERHVGDRLISRFGPVNWPPRSCDLTPLDYFLWGYVKSLVYADKPQTLGHLEDNIRRVIADRQP
ncbi:hypothetical protein TNCV_3910391 [Trichonephila clavipes]|nr:hypothetical protein TNCV_3910391 [Trichonephila clavipes]